MMTSLATKPAAPARRAGSFGRMLPVLLLAAMLAACGGDNFDDLRSYMEQVKARHRGKVPPLPVVNQAETYRYQAESLRDPFQATFVDPNKAVLAAKAGGPVGGVPEAGRRREPLENYPLDTLKMLGSMNRAGQVLGVVKAADGAMYTVKVGNYMGQNNGKVVRITENKIELRELISDGLGGWEQRSTSLALNN